MSKQLIARPGIIQTDMEVYECAGCGGEVSIVEAVWLPEQAFRTHPQAKPYCCKECCRAWLAANKQGGSREQAE
jgi:hypothetical protein